MIAYVLAVVLWLLIFGVVWTWMISAGRADRFSEKKLNEDRMRRRLERQGARQRRSDIRNGGGFRG